MKMWAKFSLILVLGGSFLATYAITLLPSSSVPDADLESRQVGVLIFGFPDLLTFGFVDFRISGFGDFWNFGLLDFWIC